jgi:hypothetical protein
MEEEPKEKPKKTRTMTPEMIEKLKVARARAMEVKKELAKKNEATKINEQEIKLNKRKSKLAEKTAPTINQEIQEKNAPTINQEIQEKNAPEAEESDEEPEPVIIKKEKKKPKKKPVVIVQESDSESDDDNNVVYIKRKSKKKEKEKENNTDKQTIQYLQRQLQQATIQQQINNQQVYQRPTNPLHQSLGFNRSFQRG